MKFKARVVLFVVLMLLMIGATASSKPMHFGGGDPQPDCSPDDGACICAHYGICQ